MLNIDAENPSAITVAMPHDEFERLITAPGLFEERVGRTLRQEPSYTKGRAGLRQQIFGRLFPRLFRSSP